MNTLLNIVGDEAAEFAALPSKVREQVVERHAAVAAVVNAGRGNKIAALDHFAAQLHVNRSTVSRWQYAFQKDGWRGLIDTRAMPRLVGSRTHRR